MPVTIKKKNDAAVQQQVQVEAAVQETELTLEQQLIQIIGAEKIEEAAHLFHQLTELKDKVKAFESDLKPITDGIQKVLQDADLPPTKKLVLETESGAKVTVAGLRKAVTILDKEALYHALEAKQEGLFFELATVGITAAKDYLPVESNPTVFDQGYGKTRTLKFTL